MAVGAFPLFKLGFLVVKQISKPIATSIAKRAKNSKFFKDFVCIPAAQLFHFYDVQVRMKMLGMGKASSVPRLNEEKAIETGSQLLSEFILLSIGASLLVLEFLRQSEKEEAKLEKIEQEKAELNDRIGGLEITLERQRTELRELKRLAYAIEDKVSREGKPRVNPPANVEHRSSSESVLTSALVDILGQEEADHGGRSS